MKLRDFVANSLPRVRGRKKKGQPLKPSVASVKEQSETNYSKTSQPTSGNNAGSPKSSTQNSGFLYPSYHRERLSVSGSERISGTESCCGSDYYATYLNTSLDEAKYLSTKEGSGFLTEHEKNSLLIYSSDSERHHHKNTRKSRSRIRTNPWLPSPSSTPYNALRSFPRGQSHESSVPVPSNDVYETDIFHSDKDVSMEMADISPTTPGSTDSGFKSSTASDIHMKVVSEARPAKSRSANPKHRKEKTKSQVFVSPESSENFAFNGQKFCVRSQTTCDLGNTVANSVSGTLEKLRWRNHEDLTSPTIGDISCFEWEQEECYPFFSCHESLSANKFDDPCIVPDPVHNISFEYEENLEIHLENPNPKRDLSNVSIAELLREDVVTYENPNRNRDHCNDAITKHLPENPNTKRDHCNVAIAKHLHENPNTKQNHCNVAITKHLHENPNTKRDQGNVAIAELLHEDVNAYNNTNYDHSNVAIAEEVTKEVAVQTDFEDAEDSDWMTASSFDDTLETLSESPRKMSLISDCMQESTDTGYSSLTRDGVLDFYGENELVANKENMLKNSLDSWFDCKEHLVNGCVGHMAHSWTEKCVDHQENLSSVDAGYSGMAHSWTEKCVDPRRNLSSDHMSQSWSEMPGQDNQSDISLGMTSSMYIPSTETMLLQNPFMERQHSPTRSTTGRKKMEQSYLPIMESGPTIEKPSQDRLVTLEESNHRKNTIRACMTWEKRPHHSRPNALRYNNRLTPNNSISSPDSENMSPPQAASTPTEKTTKHRNKTHLLEGNKSQLGTVNSRVTRSKKSDSRKPRDNLDAIREYLGYASFEDFYSAKQCPPLSTGRTLNQIKTSLEEKVDRLRQEKLLVEMKISEAQEEERARRQEVAKFQQKLHLQRKHLLVQTLHDLKVKLENQSDRLQKSYSTILNLQHRFSRQNSNSSFSLLKSGPM